MRKINLRCAYLEYDYDGKRGGNIGGEIIFSLLTQYVEIADRCDASQINNYDLVLISIPSSGQMIDVYRLARKYRFWVASRINWTHIWS